MRDSRAVQKFLPGIKYPWFELGKASVTGLDDHKNDFVKTKAYLDSFVQHVKGGRQKISKFHAQGSGGGRHRGCLGRGVRGRRGCNVRGGRVRRRGSGGREENPILTSDNTLIRSWRFLAKMRR